MCIDNSTMKGEDIMNRIEYRIVAGLVATAIGFAPMAFAAAADTNGKTSQPGAESPAANAPLIGRIVVRPSPEQMAKFRLEKRRVALEGRAGVGQQAAGGQVAATGAL